jgi:DNA-binding transcriptional LysR family regulator
VLSSGGALGEGAPDLSFEEARELPGPGALRLAASPRVVIASPSYLARAPLLSEPADLGRHDCLRLREGSWRLFGPRGEVEVGVSGSVLAASGEALLPPLLGGVGVALLPLYLVERELQLGALVRVLAGYRDDGWGIFALPGELACSSPARVFLGFVTKAVLTQQGME